jgi:hypothetical protein
VKRLALVTAVLLVLPQPITRARDAALDALLGRIGAQVASFQTEFSRVVGVEHYNQVLRDIDRRSRTRQLESEVFFFGRSEDQGALTVRSVRRVNGRNVRGGAEDIERALAMPTGQRVARLKALADAGARYNLGSLRRNFNEPTLALMFGSEAFRERFKFSTDGEEVADGKPLVRVAFAETSRPTVIRDGRNGANIPASGRLWADSSGRVWRSELRLDKSDTLATIRVTYRYDPKLEMLVPATMDEDYRYREADTKRMLFISGHASYSDYRRFETSVRILP